MLAFPLARSLAQPLAGGLVRSSGFTDPDALAFAATSGATDIASLSNTFAALKEAGYWDGIAITPLKHGTNAPTGTTFYSAGGYTTARVTCAAPADAIATMRTGVLGLLNPDGSNLGFQGPIEKLTVASFTRPATYGFGAMTWMKAVAAFDRGLYQVGTATGNIAGGVVQHKLNGSGDIFSKGIEGGQWSAIGFVQEAASVCRALGERVYSRGVAAVDSSGTSSALIGVNTSSSAVNSPLEIGAFWFHTSNSIATWRGIRDIVKKYLLGPVSTATQHHLISAGQSQAQFTYLAGPLEKNHLLPNLLGTYRLTTASRSNQPISGWVDGSGVRQSFYTTDIWNPSGAEAVFQTYYNLDPLNKTRGVFWFQGEADAGYSQAGSDATLNAIAAVYEDRLQRLVTNLRADMPNVPIVLMQVDWTTATGAQVTRLATIRAAQAAVVAANSNMALVDTRGMAREADGIHLTSAGSIAAAAAAYAAYLTLTP